MGIKKDEWLDFYRVVVYTLPTHLCSNTM